jgi:predicted nucleic acid-binding protein
MRLLDVDVLVDIQRQHPPAAAWYHSLTELPSVPGLVVMELVQDAQNRRQVQEALRLVKPLPVVWPTDAECDRALKDFIDYHLSHSLGLLDALIAACAIGRGATLCTFNVKSTRFAGTRRVIAGLVTEQPYNR